MMARRSWLKLLALYAAIEVIGVLVGSAGLAVEFVYGADVGFILITTGGLAFGVGSGLWAKAFVHGGRR